MGIIDRLRLYFYTKSLPLKAARSKGVRIHNLDEAKYIGILFDGTEIDDRNTVLRYADKLRKAGIAVALLG